MELTNITAESAREPEPPRREPTLPINIFIEDTEALPEVIQSTHRRQNGCLLSVLCGIALLGFPPLGILAVYFLFKAKTQFQEGNIQRARTYALYAQFFSLLAILLSMMWIGLLIGLTV